MKAIEFYSGVGGFSLGMKNAGFDVQAAFEIDWRHVETYNRNFGQDKAICTDVSRIDFEKESHGLDLKDIDVVFGGPPCQGFSNGGKQNIDDARNNQLLVFAKLVRQVQPKAFVLENVSGLLNKKFKPLLDEFFEISKRNGYSLYDPILLNAKDYLVPQNRKRVFIIGVKKNRPDHLYISPNIVKQKFENEIDSVTVEDALKDILHINLEPNTSDTYLGELNEASLYSSILHNEESGFNGISNSTNGISGFTTSKHTLTTIERFSKTRPGCVEPISRYKRLHLEGLSSTLRAGTIRGRGQFMAPRPIHPLHHRCITTREAARLHSYPDWFQFYPTKWYGMMQIGNSVPPNLSLAIGESLKKIID